MNLFRRIRWRIILFFARRVLPCHAITHIISESRDRSLTIRERFALQSHLAVCDWCTRFGHQVSAFERALETAGDEPEKLTGQSVVLSESARDSIRRRITSPE